MHQHPGALDMPQEIMAQAQALTGALHQAGNIRQHKAVFPLLYDAQVGLQGGKMIIGDLRPSGGEHGKHGGFAHVGEAHQTYVRNGLQFQRQLHHFPLFAGLGELGGLPGGGGEVLIAISAVTAVKQGFLFAGVVHVQKQPARGLFPHHRSRRHLDDHVFSGLAGAPVGRAVRAVAGFKMPLEAEIHQRMHPFRGQKHHVAAPSAVAAVRAARGNVFFPVKGHAAVAAVAGLHPDIDNIYKKRHRSSFPPRQLAAQVSLHKCSFKGHRPHSGPRA